MIKIENSSLQQRYIGDTPVGRIYIGNNLVWETQEGYGVRWVHDGDGTITRIGNLDYHRTLPIQSQMKRCILKSDGTV